MQMFCWQCTFLMYPCLSSLTVSPSPPSSSLPLPPSLPRPLPPSLFFFIPPPSPLLPPLPPTLPPQNGTATIEEFHQEIQTVTNHPLRQFIIPFLRVSLQCVFKYTTSLCTLRDLGACVQWFSGLILYTSYTYYVQSLRNRL